jgi:hypothetical protein
MGRKGDSIILIISCLFGMLSIWELRNVIPNGQGDPLRKRGEELPGPAPYTFTLHGYS